LFCHGFWERKDKIINGISKKTLRYFNETSNSLHYHCFVDWIQN
jgi:hypothetical protein